jgi:hypothetical protein
VRHGTIESAHSPLDIALPISLRFPNYFAMRFWRGAEPPQEAARVNVHPVAHVSQSASQKCRAKSYEVNQA